MTFSYTPFFALWMAIGLLSAWFFYQKQYRYGLFLLFLTGFALRCWAASLDPFLHDWDERFHAIVAKNMMYHPFKPMLRANPAVAYDYTAWCCNHVWLHKQPLFLWQMALSMRLFGVNELALRLPSVLAGALLVFPIFGIGRRVYTPVLGYLAAFAWAFGYFSIELAAGVIGMDHNDLSFAFYITGSVWAFLRYVERPALRNALLMGAFAGAAILCKWLVGLLVFGAYGVYALLPGNRVQKITHGTKALLMTLAVAVPWQVYTFIQFPREAAHEMSYNLRHLAEVVETKGGDWAFYWRQLPYQYGYWAEYLLVTGLVFGVVLTRRYPRLWYLLLLLALPFVFFSFLAKTKMIAYSFCVGPLVMLVLLTPLAWLLEMLRRRLPRLFPVALALALTGCGAYFLRPLEIWTVTLPTNQRRT